MPDLDSWLIPFNKWVAQVSLLRPGFLLANGSRPEHPGLKSETWATHSRLKDAVRQSVLGYSSRPGRAIMSRIASSGDFPCSRMAAICSVMGISAPCALASLSAAEVVLTP